MRYLLDEHLSHKVAEGLRRRKVDAAGLTEVSYRHLRGEPDQVVLEAAAADGRAIVTFDVGGFVDLHRSWILSGQHHAGIVLVPRPRLRSTDIGGLVKALQNLANTHKVIDDQLLWLQL